MKQLAKVVAELGKFTKTDTPTEEYRNFKYLHVYIAVIAKVVH